MSVMSVSCYTQNSPKSNKFAQIAHFFLAVTKTMDYIGNMRNEETSPAEFKYFTSQEAARILGVNVSTIKRWTDEGKLECISSPGGHRKFLISHLARCLETYKTGTSKVNLFPVENEADLEISHRILKRDFPFLTEYVLNHALECRRELIQQVLNGLYLAQVPLHEIYDKIMVPVLYRIGRAWNDGHITVAREHLASQCIKDTLIRLQGIIRIPREKSGTAICVNLSDELHDIALKMIDHLLELKGLTVLFSGQMTPSEDLEELISDVKPDRLYISSTVVRNVPESQIEFDRCCVAARAHGASIFIGGSGFNLLAADHDCIRLNTFKEVAEV